MIFNFTKITMIIKKGKIYRSMKSDKNRINSNMNLNNNGKFFKMLYRLKLKKKLFYLLMKVEKFKNKNKKK